MARTTGALNFSANYEVKVRKPLDSRSIVASFDDLIAAETWGEGENCVAYNGMLVTVEGDGIYRLHDADWDGLQPVNTKTENWHKVAEISDLDEMRGRINEVETTVTTFTNKVDVEKVSTAIAEAVEAEILRATASEEALASRITEVEGNKAGYVTADHTHTAEQITNFETAVATKVESYGYVTAEAAETDATNKANTAKQEAIDAAATDATEKADAAKTAAIEAAAADATAKADAAKADAATDATNKANTAKEDALATAAEDATTKANTAKQEAINTAATDATTKANTAEANAKAYADANDTALSSRVTAVENNKAPNENPTFTRKITFQTTSGVADNNFSMNRWGAHLDKQGCHSATLGYANVAASEGAVALGYFTWAAGPTGQTVAGRYNKNDNIANAVFVVGDGTADNTRRNAFRVDVGGSCYAGANYGANGADFAEYLEWLDGNLNEEDRRGRFVTLVGDKIALATAEDEAIGIVSASAAYVGNTAHEDWQGKYMTDVFGTKLVEYIEVPAIIDEATGETIAPAQTVPSYILNPSYKAEEEYLPRSERREWTVVGFVGQIVAVDDGTCVVGGRVKPGVNGIGTASTDGTGYIVMKRLDETHIKVLVK